MGLSRIVHFLIPLFPLAATWVGNPEQPAIMNSGVIRSRPADWSFRLGYYGDYVYRQRLKDEFKIGKTIEKPTHIQLWTQAGVLTFNARERIDLYVILGGSRLKIDEEVLTNQQFAWGIGGKLIVVHEGRFRLGVDIKYFQTDQKPHYFLSEGYAYNMMSDFGFTYSEIQAAMGLSYRTKYVSPYINATYLISRLEPHPLISLVRLPTMDYLVDVISKSVIGNRRWGMAIGATLIDLRKATLAVEWRAFNQNAVTANGEIRF